MGYTTTFCGEFKVDPPLSKAEIDYLEKFSRSRRMHRKSGPYFVDGKGEFGSNDPDVIDQNTPPKGQPGLWCQWVPSEDGKEIHWDDGEKFYEADDWIRYLIEHFLKPGAKAVGKVPGIVGGHIVSGWVEAQGEEDGDLWAIDVKSNKVRILRGRVVYGELEEDFRVCRDAIAAAQNCSLSDEAANKCADAMQRLAEMKLAGKITNTEG
jgi:hypothetical protein